MELDTVNINPTNRNFQLLKFPDIQESVRPDLSDDPLEEMLYGIEINRDISLVSNQKKIESQAGIELERKIKHLRFYVNEISDHFGLDE